MSGTESIEVALGRVVRRLVLAQSAAAANAPLDLTDFQHEVEAACQRVAGAPAEQARASLPTLRALMHGLDRLAETLADRAAAQATPETD